MVKIATTIEDDLLDAFLFGALGDQLTDFSSSGDVAAIILLFTLFTHGGCRGNGDSVEIVDELGVDVVERAIDVEAWTLGGAGHLLANARVNALADHVALTGIDHSLISFLVAYSEC